MTLASASSITGYEVSILFGNDFLTLVALDDNGDEYHRFSRRRCPRKRSEKQIKEMAQAFVDWNYERVSEQVREEQKYRCAQCGKMKPLQTDHIEKRSQGRDDRRSNLRALCAVCHEVRHGRKTSA